MARRRSANTKLFTLDNMSGGINSRSEENALVSYVPAGSNDYETLVRAEARDIENFLPLNRGGQTKTFGYSTYKDTGTVSRITGLARFIKKDGTNLFIFSQADKIYKLVAGTITDLGTTITSGALVHFETADDKLVACDGTREPLLFDGTSFATMGGTPPAQARQSVWYQDRLFIFGKTTDPSLLFYSDGGNIEAGYASNFINCDTDDGQEIVAIAKFFIPGSLTPIIFVGKERSVGIVDGYGTAGSPYTFKKIAFDVGVSGFRQLVQFGQDLSFLYDDGIHSYQGAVTDVNIKRNNLTSKVYDQFKALPAATLSDAIGWHDRKNERLSYAVTETGFSHPNVIWNLDLINGGWYKIRPSDKITAVLVDTDGTVYFGDEGGIIYNWDEDVDTFNSGAIAAYYTTPYMDFGAPNVWKRILGARMTIRGNGQYALGVSVNLNFGTETGTSISITLTSGVYTWGGGVWTSDSNVYQWGNSPIFHAQFFPGGWFKNIQFEFTQSGADQPVDLFELELLVEFGAMR